MEGLRLSLSCHDHTTLMKAGLQPSCHFLGGFHVIWAFFCGHMSCPALLHGALGQGLRR